MENVNYNEKVVVPFLEKKCKDLLSVNLVLEAKLLVEQSKTKDFESIVASENEQLNKLKNDLNHANETINHIQMERNKFESERNETINHIQMERNKFESERNELLNRCLREESLKNNAISEYQNLNTKYSELLVKIQLIEDEAKKKNVKKVVTQMS